MKKFLLSAIIALTATAASAQKNTLLIGTYNVDGLPQEVGGIPIKPDGAGPEKSPIMGQKIAERGWDVAGLNEDFNYHAEVSSGMPGYTFATHQGKFEYSAEAVIGIVMGTWRFPIDGLMLCTAEGVTATNENAVPWRNDAVYGYLDHYQDSLTMKGFRSYTVTVGDKDVDVMILHADAGYDHLDRNARINSMDQICEYIESLNSTNPLIVMGDFNNLYFRDNMKELFIDRLNKAEGLDVHDCWVDFINNGVYPEHQYPAPDDDDPKWNDDDMPFTEKSETLDKIIYINRASSAYQLVLKNYQILMNFTDEEGKQLSDHKPIEAEFEIALAESITEHNAEDAEIANPVSLHGFPVSKGYNGIVVVNGKKYNNWK